MSNVKVRLDEFQNLTLNGIFTGGTKQGRYGPSVNNEIVVLYDASSKNLFTGMKDMQTASFSIDNGPFEDYYYIASDERGFIFQTNP